jgi:hypothetical protein
VRVFLKSAQAAQARLERTRNSPLLPGRSESVVRVFHKSAQAAQARLERTRNSPLLPGRSESGVRVFLTKLPTVSLAKVENGAGSPPPLRRPPLLAPHSESRNTTVGTSAREVDLQLLLPQSRCRLEVRHRCV